MKYLIPISAVCFFLLFIVQFASAADEEEPHCSDAKRKECNKVYQKEINDAGNSNYEAICNAIRKLVDCYTDAFQCDEDMAQRWRLAKVWYFMLYNGTCDWSDMYDAVPPEFASGIAFGDPHYAINGKDGVKKVVTCNKAGRILLAQGRRWSVHVNHKVVGSEGAVVDEVVVKIYPAVTGFNPNPTGTPLREVTYTLSSLPKEETADGITIRPDGLTTEWGLEVSAKRRDGSYFEVGVSGPDMNNGILVNGNCEAGGIDTSTSLRRHYHAQADSTLPVPEKCKSVDKVFQQACAYDAKQLNETWAADSTTSAVSLATVMKEKEKKSQEEANKKFTTTSAAATGVAEDPEKSGVAGTMIQGSALLLSVMAIIMF